MATRIGTDYGHAQAAIRNKKRSAENWRAAAARIEPTDQARAKRYRIVADMEARREEELRAQLKVAVWRCRKCGAEVQTHADSEPRTVCDHSFGWNYGMVVEDDPSQ